MAARSYSQRALAPAPPGYAHEVREPRPLNKVSRACIECRKRKVKCTGETPCKTCAENNVTCTIDEENDGRRKISLKRKVESLERDNNLLLKLVESIRTDDEEVVARLLDTIRSKNSLDDIRSFLADQLADQPRPTMGSPMDHIVSETPSDGQTPEYPNVRPKVMDVKRLSDEPIYDVPAKPWTTVTDDDHFVSHLISLWFTWHNSTVFSWMHHELFIRDMQSQRLDSFFCSPFLVNVMLAEACTYSDYPESFAVRNDPTSRGGHFYQEAKRLLDAEEGRMTLATAQGLGMMYTWATVMGKDRLGWLYGIHAVEGARELTTYLSSQGSEVHDYPPGTKDAVENVIWALFSALTVGSLALQRPPPMKRPLRDRSRSSHDKRGPTDTWTAYPMQIEPHHIHSECIFDSLADLTLISYDVVDYLFGEDRLPRAQLAAAASFTYDRLCLWHESLPHCVSIGPTVIPQVLCIHMYYHTIIMTIYGFLKYPTVDDDDDHTHEHERDLKAGGNDPIASALFARERCIASALRVAKIMEIHRTQWRMAYAPAAYLHWINIALFTLLEDLDNPTSCRAFVILCHGARFFATRWPLAKGVFRLIQLSTKRMQINLPPEVLKLFQDFETELWRAEDRPRFSSLYPNFAVAVQKRKEGGGAGAGALADSAELDKFLEKWDHLKVSNCRDS